MEKFNCRVERIDEYTIEFDEDIINEKWMENFRAYMYNFHTLSEHAEHIAQHRARLGRGFIEGYGYPLENGKIPYWVPKDRYNSVNKGINVISKSEDDDIYVDVWL